MSIRTPTRVDVAFVGAVCRGIGNAMSEHKYRWVTEFAIGAGLIFVLYEMVQVGETVPATVLSGAFVVRYGVTAAEISEGVRYAMAQADDRREKEYGDTEMPRQDSGEQRRE